MRPNPAKSILLILWQLPQFLVGAVTALIAQAWQVEKGEWVAHAKWFGGAISLTDHFRIYDTYLFSIEQTRRHEFGHTIQSKMLGPLYLIVIGLPSLIWAALYTGPYEGYFKFYTERWANKLGGIN